MENENREEMNLVEVSGSMDEKEFEGTDEARGFGVGTGIVVGSVATLALLWGRKKWKEHQEKKAKQKVEEPIDIDAREDDIED